MRTREHIGIVVFGKRAVFGRMRTFSLLVVSMIPLYVELFFSAFFPSFFPSFFPFLFIFERCIGNILGNGKMSVGIWVDECKVRGNWFVTATCSTLVNSL